MLIWLKSSYKGIGEQIPLRDKYVTIAMPLRFMRCSLLIGGIVGCLAQCPLPALAANPLLKPGSAAFKKQSSSGASGSAVLSDEQIDSTISRIRSREDELRSQPLPEGVDLLTAGIPNGATPDEYQEWQRLTSKIINRLDSRVESLRFLKDVRQSVKALEAQRKGWRGFSEKPPYPLSLVDSLQDTIQARQIEQHSYEMRLAFTEGELADFTSLIKESQTQRRLAEERLEQSAGKPEEARLLWQLALASRRNELNETTLVSQETQRETMQEGLAWLRQEISFLDQKLTVASGNFRFTQEELDKKLKGLDAQNEQLKLDMEVALSTEDYERGEQAKVRESMQRLKATMVTDGQSLTVPPRLAAIRQALEIQQVRVETASIKVLSIKIMSRLIQMEQGLWKNRFQLANPGKNVPIPDVVQLQKGLETIQGWKKYLRSRLDGVEIYVRNQQNRISTADLSDKERGTARILLNAYREQKTLMYRVEDHISRTEQLILRFLDEISAGSGQSRPVAAKLKNKLLESFSYAGKIWNTSLYVAEETVIIDGQKIVKSRSVTIGKVIQALLIFFIGIFAARKLMVPVQKLAARKFTLNENDAQVFGRVSYYVLFICILVFSLVTVNIPLAVFAFFGGALAIGVGFGAQTLINNFISGLILLFDRSIRLNDVVEVDGQRGRVVAINIRSSRVRRFDGIEILIPNSHFLQQNVVNLTLSDPFTRFEIAVGVAYGTPTRTAEEVVFNAVVAQPEVRKDPPPFVVFEDFADSSLNFRAFFWVDLDPTINSNIVRSEIRHRISEYLAQAEISIPFPQRDLHLNATRPLEISILERPAS
jgi:small-conductance mechanosensitive channel